MEELLFILRNMRNTQMHSVGKTESLNVKAGGTHSTCKGKAIPVTGREGP
jgi:hypothetical protein